MAVIGGAAERARFEEECGRQGWAVLEQSAGSGTDGRYVMTLTLFGLHWRAAQGAEEQLRAAARRLDLAVRVLAAERVGGVGEGGPESMWRVVGTSSTSAAGRLRPTGRRVWAADETAALRLARRRLPDTPTAPPGVRVRGEVQADSRPFVVLLRNTPWLILTWVALRSFTFGVDAVWSGRAGGEWLAMAGGSVVAFVSGWGAHRLLQRVWKVTGTQVSLNGVGDTAVLCLFAGALGLSGAEADGGVGGLLELVRLLGLLALSAPVPLGLYFLFHSSGWRSVAPWLLPLVIPLFIGLLPGAGGLLIRQYLDAFDTEPADVGVSLYRQFGAASSWLPVILLALSVPALLGYLRIWHFPIRNRGVMVFAGVVAVILGSVGFDNYLLAPARQAGVQAMEAAARWRTPPEFHGVEPRWVCATPLANVDPSGIPVVGGTFSPARAYLMLGDSGGTVVLWTPPAPGAAETLEVPLAKLRIRDIDRPWRGCRP
ncbi:hypothetical protein EJC51_32640 [Streptomyces aquilus]|uniref:Uncharacterized protein n=1 Tax=Streptomyces aquilus TaxID=2548456 RepID=A0A3Q9C4E3_9ACTN|nr:hypothetical protein [Streptomyces aquilus]AZP20409.1 hypothetical protein EJC51_32640 [Streptomyces aquilus]